MHGKRLFTGLENVKGRFLFDVAPVHEIEHPFRSCNHAVYVHFWPRKALVLGWWKKRHSETENLMRAVGGRNVEKGSTFGFPRDVLPDSKKKITADEFS
jgi:hypothetical protein